MKKTKLYVLNGILVLCLLSTSANAKFLPDLHRYFDEKITQVDESVCTQSEDEPTGGEPPHLILQAINIDIIPTVTFGLSGVLSLSISPEIDFVLTRDE